MSGCFTIRVGSPARVQMKLGNGELPACVRRGRLFCPREADGGASCGSRRIV